MLPGSIWALRRDAKLSSSVFDSLFEESLPRAAIMSHPSAEELYVYGELPASLVPIIFVCEGRAQVVRGLDANMFCKLVEGKSWREEPTNVRPELKMTLNRKQAVEPSVGLLQRARNRQARTGSTAVWPDRMNASKVLRVDDVSLILSGLERRFEQNG